MKPRIYLVLLGQFPDIDLAIGIFDSWEEAEAFAIKQQRRYSIKRVISPDDVNFKFKQ